MYRKITNFLQGHVTVQVESPYPERVVNLCAVHQIPFWDLRWLDAGTFRISTTRRGLRQLRQAVEGVDCAIISGRERGAPILLGRFRRHYVLLAGFVLFLALLFGGNLFIWEFRVTGNDTVPDEVILRTLEEYGITVGSVGLNIDQEAMRNHVLLELPDISWLAVNVKGCVAHVQVVERQRPPQMIRDDEISNVVASRTGLVTQIDALDGKEQVAVGETVVKGQLLISGVADSAQTGMRLMHSLGQVWARTWYELSVLVPLETEGRGEQESSVTRVALDLGKHRIKIYGKGSMVGSDCDKITQYYPLTLPGGFRLPITLVTERTVRYSTTEAERTEAQARSEGETTLLQLLEQQMTEGGTVQQTKFSTARQGSYLLVTLKAECLEQIGEQVLLPTQ